MKVKVTEFLAELSRYGIEVKHRSGRIELVGGDADAREHYTELVHRSPEFEGALVWELAQRDVDVMDWIEERRAINWVDCGDDSVRTAIMCSIPRSK